MASRIYKEKDKNKRHKVCAACKEMTLPAVYNKGLWQSRCNFKWAIVNTANKAPSKCFDARVM